MVLRWTWWPFVRLALVLIFVDEVNVTSVIFPWDECWHLIFYVLSY